jgi:anthranilate synthase/aminodeoxychorismate synthase-like glutamine amidotransferase
MQLPAESGRGRTIVVRVLVLDHHDSFTWNLVQYLRELGASTDVLLSDSMPIGDVVERRRWDCVVLSPGPGSPNEAVATVELVRRAPADLPMFGVCLGMQCMVRAFGGRIVRASNVVHGKVSAVYHDGTGAFRGLPSPMNATRYHSLAVDDMTLPDCLEVHAWTREGTIMAIRHVRAPLEGVQFHPESILTEHGKLLLDNWLRAVGALAAATES